MRPFLAGTAVKLATALAVAVVRVGERLQRVVQGCHPFCADPLLPFALDLGDQAARGGDLLATAVGDHDERRAPVGRVRCALDVAAALQGVDEVAHRLVGHLGALGEHSDPRAAALQVLEDRRVGGSQIDILPALAPEAGDVVVSKHRFSGFFETRLDAILKEHGITWLVFTGCTTSICVESTLRDAFFRDYRCLLLEDCTAEPIGSDLPHTNHDASVRVIETLLGWVSDSATFEAVLKQPAAVSA